MVYTSILPQACKPDATWHLKEYREICADSTEELLEFAKKIGLKKDWLRKNPYTHFRISNKMYIAAVRYDIKVLTANSFISKRKKLISEAV